MSGSQRDTADSGIMNYALRMVIPIRREFGRALDVQHFLHDLAYAKEVLDEARSSQNPKLREYAEYLDKKILGPRNTTSPGNSTPNPLGLADAAPADNSAAAENDRAGEDEARKLMLAKYKGGLR